MKNNLSLQKLEKKLDFFTNNVTLSLLIIGGIALILRLSIFHQDIPLTIDALLYFWYANDLSILQEFPIGHIVVNNGWPTFLSLFFSIFSSNNFMDYLSLQRIVTIFLSVLTVIPMYLFCRKFFEKSYSILGAAIFVLEPRIIQNSLLGITEPLYILLGVIALVLFLSSDKKKVYVAFGVVALCTLVRSEGVFFFLALSILYFIKYKKEGKIVIPKYVIVIGIFALVLLPMVLVRIDTVGNDFIFSRIVDESKNVLSYSEENIVNIDHNFLAIGVENLPKFLAWTSLPIFIIFVPLGSYLIFKNRNFQQTTVIVAFFVMIIPAFYAYSLPALDTRYLFFLYPFYCICSVLTIKFFGARIKKKKNTFLLIILGVILLLSLTFLEIKKTDIDHQREALNLAYIVSNMTSTVFTYFPESGYLDIVGLTNLQDFPILKEEYEPKRHKQVYLYENYDSMAEYIEYGRKDGLTHLVLDELEKRRPAPFKDAFYHEEKYPYLIKEFDSKDHGYNYHLKIFRIDYDLFDIKENVKLDS